MLNGSIYFGLNNMKVNQLVDFVPGSTYDMSNCYPCLLGNNYRKTVGYEEEIC